MASLLMLAICNSCSQILKIKTNFVKELHNKSYSQTDYSSLKNFAEHAVDNGRPHIH